VGGKGPVSTDEEAMSRRHTNKQAAWEARHMRKMLVHVAGCVWRIDSPGCCWFCAFIGSLYIECEHYEALAGAIPVRVPRSLRPMLGRTVP
jgi:hypothetical protein